MGYWAHASLSCTNADVRALYPGPERTPYAGREGQRGVEATRWAHRKTEARAHRRTANRGGRVAHV